MLRLWSSAADKLEVVNTWYFIHEKKSPTQAALIAKTVLFYYDPSCDNWKSLTFQQDWIYFLRQLNFILKVVFL
jgi:hypothetical protein